MEVVKFVALTHVTNETLNCKMNLDSRLRGNDKKAWIPDPYGINFAGMTVFVRGA
jgi:hypothetical protein